VPHLRSSFRFMAARVAVVLVVLAAPGCRPDGASPAEERTVRRGDDLLAGGPALVLRQAVPGDVIAAGGSIEFSGTAGGDYLGVGGQQTIAGQIQGSVRAAGGEMWLQAAVERNATLAGGRIVLQRGATIAGNAYFAGGEILVNGTVDGVLQATGGRVRLDGGVGEDVHVQAGQLQLGAGARIGGDLRYSVDPQNVTIDPGAQIAGEVIVLPPPARPAFLLLRIAWHLGFLVAGAAAIALLPRIAAAATHALQHRPWAAAGFGLLWVIGVPLAAGLLALTVIGIPLALILLALYVIALYLARAVVALWLGRLLLGSAERPGRGGVVLSFLLGGVVLVVVSLLPILGALVAIVATVLGLGAAMLLLGRRPAGAT
jgi:cytoskeletal protein CcmA (bactofilin family)